MKNSWLFKSVFVLIFFFIINSTLSQDLNTYQMVGKSMDYAISKYGKPAHQDLSNKSMQCVFYKTKTYQTVFVANEQGIFQCESSVYYDKKSEANQNLSSLISKCNKDGFSIDTVNIAEFNIYRNGLKLNVSLFENTYSNKYEVKVKASRSEGMK
jgi:hypothetical protein